MRPFNNNSLRWKADSAVFPSLPAPFPCPPSLPPARTRPPPDATRCELYPSFASVALPEAGGRSPQTVSAAGQRNTVSDAAHRQADRQLAVSLAAPTTPAATRWHALGSQPRPAPTNPRSVRHHFIFSLEQIVPPGGKILAYAQRRLLSSRVYR